MARPSPSRMLVSDGTLALPRVEHGHPHAPSPSPSCVQVCCLRASFFFAHVPPLACAPQPKLVLHRGWAACCASASAPAASAAHARHSGINAHYALITSIARMQQQNAPA